MPSLHRLILPPGLLALAAPATATQGPWNFYCAHGSDRLIDLAAARAAATGHPC